MESDDQRRAMLAEYLLRHADGEQRIADLLWHSVGRVMLKDRRQVVQLHVAMEEEDMVGHIVDWLKVAVLENASWLGKTDGHGRPKKLLKFGTLEAIHAEADRWMRRRQASRAALLVEGDEETYFDLGDGWSMVRLLTAAALDRETTIMQHCIGHGSYDGRLSEGGTLFLSLRDPYGMPHATLEINNGAVIQFQGKQNRRPIAKYVTRCLPFFSVSTLSRLPDDVVRDRHGVVHAICNLPEVLCVDGPLFIHNTTEGLRLPNLIEATGSVTLTGSAFANVPTQITTRRSLAIQGRALPRLPETLEVKEGISLHGSVISELPEGMTVEGSLDLNSSAVRRLPRALTVRGYLDITWTVIDHLPEDLRCTNINISHTRIKRFDTSVFIDDKDPDSNRGLVASWSDLEEITGTPHFSALNISGAKLTALPDGLEVAGNLDISNTAIGEITSAVKIGSLNARECELRIDLSRIEGNVCLASSSVSMPEEFRSGSTMRLQGAKLRNVRRITASTIELGVGPIPAALVADIIDFRSRADTRIEGDIVANTIEVRAAVEFIADGVSAQTVRVGYGKKEISLAEAREVLLKEGSLRSKVGSDFVVGRTGGGKSSTLLRALSSMNQANARNHVTIEDPPEYIFTEMRIVRPRVPEGQDRRLPLLIPPDVFRGRPALGQE